MSLKKTFAVLAVISVVLCVAAAAEDLSVIFKDGGKQTMNLVQPAANISKIEFAAGDATGPVAPASTPVMTSGLSGTVPPAVPAAAVAIPAVTAASTGTDPAGYVKGFEGKWNSKWGVLTFVVDGTKVTGDYTYSSGKIVAALGSDGKTMEGTWSEAPTYAAPQYSGRCTFTLASDGNRIDGHWWYGDGKDGGEWNGIRIK